VDELGSIIAKSSPDMTSQKGLSSITACSATAWTPNHYPITLLAKQCMHALYGDWETGTLFFPLGPGLGGLVVGTTLGMG